MVDLDDVLVDIVRHRRLLLGRRGDLLVLVDDHAHRAEDVLQGLLHLGRLADRTIRHLVTGVHRLHRRPHTALQLGDHRFDLFGGLLRALGQVAHLVSHHGETATLFTSPRRLDGSIERQQVGLLGDTLDHIEHLADRRTVAGQLVDHRHRLIDFTGKTLDRTDLLFDQRAATDRFLIHALRATHRSGGAARHLLGSGGHLVHRRGHLLDLCTLTGHRLVALA